MPYLVSYALANHTPSGVKVVRMNQNFNVGPAKSLKVFPGDKVDLSVWTYYENAAGFGNGNVGNLTTFIANVAAAFGGVSGAGGESGNIFNGVNGAFTKFGDAPSHGDTQPGAYLNYILFDVNYKVLDMGYKIVPTTALNTQQKISFPTITAKEPGYVFMYLSYEDQSNNYVQFDDLSVTLTKTNIIQNNEYYPFGLQTSSSWTRENNKNDFKYNAGSELNNSAGWYETFFRGYDAAVGRFLQVDPMATMYGSQTGYQYALNNPVLMNDPSGGVAETIPPCDYCLYGLTIPERDANLSWKDNYTGYATWNGLSTLFSFFDRALSPNSTYRQATWKNGVANFSDKDANPFRDFDMVVVDWYTYGIQDAEHYIETTVEWRFKKQQQPFGGGEKVPSSLYTIRSEFTSYKDLLHEFLTGTGPERSLFGSHHLTNEMKQSAIIKRAKEFYADNIKPGETMLQRHFDFFATDVLFVHSDIEQFIGSARVSIIPADGGFYYVIDNTTSRHSGSFDTSANIPRSSISATPMGNIYQRFIWFEEK